VAATPAVKAKSKPPRRIGQRQETIAGYALIGLPMLFFLVLSIGVFLYALFISFWKWNIRTGPIRIVGIDNYTRILSDPLFQIAVKNTSTTR